jgi:endonuclease YncB( thermonuclease family)
MADWHWPDSIIHNVVDGDTFDSIMVKQTKVDVGFNIVTDVTTTLPMRLRLARINAARSSSKKGQDAKALVISRTANVKVHIITIKPYKYSGPDKMVSEYMAEVILPDGSNLSDLLVTLGLATYWDGNGPRPNDG